MKQICSYRFKGILCPLAKAAPMQAQSSSVRQSQRISGLDASVVVIVVAILSSSENGVICGATGFMLPKCHNNCKKMESKW
ncbi:hypothetical protein ACLKA7_005310 [Drosophila subpalustris]